MLQGMQLRSSKVLALLGGVATLAVGSTFMLRAAAPRPRLSAPCAPRLLELERAVCDEPLLTEAMRAERSELALQHAAAP
jgi:hypothetical protein